MQFRHISKKTRVYTAPKNNKFIARRYLMCLQEMPEQRTTV